MALATAGAKVKSSGDTTVPDRHELRQVNDGRYGNSRSWMSNEMGRGWVEVELPAEATIERVMWGRDREGRYEDRLAIDYRIEVASESGPWRTVADVSDRRKPAVGKTPSPGFDAARLPMDEAREATRLLIERNALMTTLGSSTADAVAFAGVFRAPDRIHRLHRGDPEQPKEEVAPAVPAVLGATGLTKDAAETARREAVATWIADPRNPLAARVMVNRIWQGHFGTGLVETSSDFGRNGTRPSHPELLDRLATEFIRDGWSMKRMHRRIVLSAVYRQSSRYDAAAASKDAETRLLWRFPPRRLEAETIRDCVLAVNGRLNPAMGGRGFDLFNQRGGLSGFTPVETFGGDGLKRMIYAHKVRREREAVFGAFDCPDAGQSTARRRESTTPIQALNLFNSRFVVEQAEALAARAKTEAGDDASAQIRRVYSLALSREPESDELGEVLPVVHEHGLPTLCRALFNSNEFLFLP